MTAHFGVDPDEMRSAAASILTTVGEVDADGLGALVGEGPSYGHHGVAGAVTALDEAARIATDVLICRATAAGEGLRTAADFYVDSDDDARAKVEQPGARLDGIRSFDAGPWEQ